jgi:hypothetical protein
MIMEQNGQRRAAEGKSIPGNRPKLTAEDKSYIERDMEYALEQIRDHIDAYISCSMVLKKTGEAAAKKELRLIIDEYLKKMKIEDWISAQDKG